MSIYTFDEISERCTVSNLEFNVYSKYKNGIKEQGGGWYGYYTMYGLLELGIYNERIAHFINFMLNNKRYNLDILEGGNGGGILLNGGVRVVMTPYNEVAFSLAIKNETHSKFPNIVIYKNTIYRSMISIMNTFFKEYALEKDKPLKLIDNEYKFEVTLEDYEILHAFFGQADCKFKKYTKEKLNNVFGKKFNDQFVISAMQLIGQEIERLEQEAGEVKDEIIKKWAKRREEIENKWHAEVAGAENKYKEKIKELEEQISLLKAQSPVS